MEETQNIQIIFPEGQIVNGNHPLVIIGPNGSGKTTFANSLSKQNNGEWIGATRNLEFSDSIAMQTLEQTTADVTNHKIRQKDSPWILSSELNQLLAKLKAEDSDSAVKFRNKAISENVSDPETTKILQLTNIWNLLFPQREIDFSSYNPLVKANHKGGATFGISRMSGGERVALYLLARVLDAPSGIIFVDEPEIHFHRVLAKKFWNELEILRSDCRFVYITHELSFGISRNKPQFIIFKSQNDHQILEQENELPDDVIESVLGAATFSVSANKIIFCEGRKNHKRDDELYTAWFDSESTAVIPVGSCNEVIRCVEVFNENPAIKGAKAIGIIDRDYRSEDFIKQLPKEIFPLDVHELESLFCLKEVFSVVAKHMGKGHKEIEVLYNEVIDEVLRHYKLNETETKKIILERVKERTSWQSKNLLNSVNNPSKNLEEIKKDYLNALDLKNWSFSPDKFFDEEKDLIDNLISNGDTADLLKMLPGKVFYSKIHQKLGLSDKGYLDILIMTLTSKDSKLKLELVKILQAYLPNV